MTSKKRVLAVALAGMLLLSSVAAAGTVRGAAANDSLTVEVEEAGNDGATVTVTQNASAVENASVTVEATNNNSYAGTGNYATDENGTVSLPEPEEDVTVEVTAAIENETGSATAVLNADEKDESETFGQMVTTFVQDMLNAGEDGGPLGQAVSEFVTSNNPGADQKSDNAGKPADAGSQGNASAENGSAEKGSQGPPEDAGNDKANGNDKGNGNAQDDDADDETTTATTEE